MSGLRSLFDRFDAWLTSSMASYGLTLLRLSVGVVFVWFGVLKFFPGLSPAEGLAAKTIAVLTAGRLSPELSLFLLAIWETFIGLGLIFGVGMRAILFLLWAQMAGTMAPLFLFPSEAFTRVPYAPSLEGQYIIKNIVLISAGIVLGATVRGGKLVAEPSEAEAESGS
ncbi:MAG TPA: DoxX family membrane protein [Anaerolineales bacterium]|nr:DoxX family membrane protein [Anaerolineales bacterium]